MDAVLSKDNCPRADDDQIGQLSILLLPMNDREIVTPLQEFRPGVPMGINIPIGLHRQFIAPGRDCPQAFGSR